jgi:hypothetical protein
MAQLRIAPELIGGSGMQRRPARFPELGLPDQKARGEIIKLDI